MVPFTNEKMPWSPRLSETKNKDRPVFPLLFSLVIMHFVSFGVIHVRRVIITADKAWFCYCITECLMCEPGIIKVDICILQYCTAVQCTCVQHTHVHILKQVVTTGDVIFMYVIIKFIISLKQCL